MLLTFADLNAPVRIPPSGTLVPILKQVLRGWEFREGGAGEATIRVVEGPGGYSRMSPWSSGGAVLSEAVDAVCDMLVDVTRQYLLDHPGLLMLHGAAVKVRGGLVVFPSTYAAGKSTLAAHLAHAGAQIYADDVLLLRETDNAGVASGVLPRLRLPLPEETKRIIPAEALSAASSRFQYVDVDVAPLGQAAPIVGLVLLERTGSGAKAIPLTKAEVLKSLLLRRITGPVSAVEVLDRMSAVVDCSRFFKLRYETCEGAVEVLKQEFGWDE
ncbi:MAG: hypothetical protein A2516_03180 [Alphaproteobacteria bacterium RIFOXYD12_FULL_60_8]|nr:MAG: hypothetical protein A2516_03180 [Alphaproteobacteria bacterium RIFOXYD12_FULL_60_8]